MMKNLSVVLIAGRENRHLKSPKQLLPFSADGAKTVLDRTIEVYLEAGASEVVLSLAHRAAEIQEALGKLDPRVKLHVAANSEAGPGQQIREGMAKISSSSKAFAIGLTDQPLLSVELLNELCAKFEASSKKILVPVCQGSIGHPVFFRSALASAVSGLDPARELWDLIRDQSSEVDDYHVYHTSIVRSIDDLDDYYELLDLARLPRPDPSVQARAEIMASGSVGPAAE